MADQDKVRIENLRRNQESDFSRWSRPESVVDGWELRAKNVASLIPAGASVLDLGCGVQSLRRFLSPASSYTPADIVKRTEDTIIVELNKGEWPTGRWGYVCSLGVLEYLYDIRQYFNGASRICTNLIVTYNVNTTTAKQETRVERGWLSDFSASDILAASQDAGFMICHIHTFRRTEHYWELVFVFEKNSDWSQE
jgi:hypothetical protein